MFNIIRTTIAIVVASLFAHGQEPNDCPDIYCNLSIEYPVFPDTIAPYVSIIITMDPPTQCGVYDQNCYSLCKPNIFTDTYGCRFTYEISYDKSDIIPGNPDMFGVSETLLTPEAVGLHFCEGCYYSTNRLNSERFSWTQHDDHFYHNEDHKMCCGSMKIMGINIMYMDSDGTIHYVFQYDLANGIGTFTVECSDCSQPEE